MLVPERLKAIIVDDNAYARAATAATLRKLGLSHITECDSGADAIGSLLSVRHDVMFMDWYMPEMSGAALIQTLRDPRFGSHGTLPVIMMTAYPSRDMMQKARDAGITEILTKPFTPAHTAAALNKALAISLSPAPDRAKAEGQVFL